MLGGLTLTAALLAADLSSEVLAEWRRLAEQSTTVVMVRPTGVVGRVERPEERGVQYSRDANGREWVHHGGRQGVVGRLQYFEVLEVWKPDGHLNEHETVTVFAPDEPLVFHMDRDYVLFLLRPFMHWEGNKLGSWKSLYGTVVRRFEIGRRTAHLTETPFDPSAAYGFAIVMMFSPADSVVDAGDDRIPDIRQQVDLAAERRSSPTPPPR